jgi:hypothetical protein
MVCFHHIELVVCCRASNHNTKLPEGAGGEAAVICDGNDEVPLKRYKMTLGDGFCRIGTEVIEVVTEGSAPGEEKGADGNISSAR